LEKDLEKLAETWIYEKYLDRKKIAKLGPIK
jgi:hypothetical protein